MCFKLKYFKFRKLLIFFYNKMIRRQPLSEQPSCNLSQDPSKSTHQQLNFIQKAYELINNPKNSEVIHWSKSGLTFIIQNIDKFQRDLLPLYFRHNRYQSFVRQLNMYDFHKIRNGEYYCENKSEFRHDQFYRGNLQSILMIKRKGFQAKIKQKQNTKIKKSHKVHNRKNLKRKKLNTIKHQQEKKSAQLIMQEEQNSFFVDLPQQKEHFIEHGVDKQKKQDKIQKIALIIVQYYQNNSHSQNLLKINKLNQIIQLAEQVKEKWVEQFQRITSTQDIRTMKDIYYRTKEQLILKFAGRSIDKNTSMRQNNELQKNYQIEMLQTIEEEDAIIESIFRAEIRSTLICINSQTFLNNSQINRKIDTLMGI